MKRVCSLLLILIMIILSIPLAQAETEAVSIKELPGMTATVWKQTYDAHGRTIDIDVAIDIPDVEKAMQAGYSTAPENVRNLGFGAGMGLPNMKRNATEFDIQSEVGVGTTITMSFALA